MSMQRYREWYMGHWRVRRGEGKKMGRAEKLPTGYNVHYWAEGYANSPDFPTKQFIHVTKRYLYP